MTACPFAVEELRTLNTRIETHMQHCLYLIPALTMGATGLIGYGLSGPHPEVLVTPLLILFPGLYLLISVWNQVYRMGAYIRVAIEPKHSENHWETRYGVLRELKFFGEERSLFVRGHTLSVLAGFYALDCLSLGLASWHWPHNGLWLLPVYLLLAFHIPHSAIAAFRAENTKRHADMWQKLLDHEEGCPAGPG